MANKAISELPQAQNVNNQDLFVLEQSGIAKKLTAETFITEQGIIDALAEALDGHGGIQSVTLQSLSGRVRTYLITFSDGSATTFQVLDGTSIDRIEKTSTAGLVDTYTIFMSDGTTSFFQVTNGGYGLDRTLTMSNAAAPADLVGDLKSTINPIFPDNEITTIFNTGKYYNDSLTLVDNTSSVYSDAIPCKGYTRVIVSTPSMLTSNSARCMGFKKNGVVSGVYTIQSLVSRCTQVGNHYETWMDIGDSDTFYMSIQSANMPINVRLTPAISTKVLDVIKPTTLYVDSTSGSDDNTGATRNAALASIQKAIDLGGKTILVKEGSYAPFSMLEKNDVLISIDPYYSDYTAVTDEGDPRIVIDGTGLAIKIGIEMNRCNRCVIKNIETKNFTSMGFRVYRCSDCRYIDCVAHDIGLSGSESVRNGYTIQFSDADFENCVAYNIGTTGAGAGSAHYDGFNIHYTGTVNFVNCSAWNCEDDGISHHDACCGYVNGGEFYNCGKGGVASPTHGAKVNVYGIYSHNNENGLYCDNTVAVTDRGNILVSNSVFKNNVVDVLVGDYYSVIATNCVYDTVSGEANITVFNAN